METVEGDLGVGSVVAGKDSNLLADREQAGAAQFGATARSLSGRGDDACLT